MNFLNSRIDHTILSPDATEDDIERVCKEAIEYRFRSVCINPIWVEFAAHLLEGTEVKLVSVGDFPLGSSFTEIRKQEARIAIEKGASEIDIVLNLGLFKSGRFEEVKNDLSEVVQVVHPDGYLKVIIEAPILSDEEIKRASKLVEEAGADFLKTGTGTRGPATIHQVNLIKETISLPIKAAGGIRDREGALSLIKAGAKVLGSSSGIRIVQG